jgi:hypothetical protein
MAFGTASNNAVAAPGGLNGSLLSLFDASYTTGLLVPHYLRTLKNKFGDNGLSDFQLLMGLGMKRGVQNITGWHWEKGLYDAPVISTGAVATPAAGATIQITSDTVAGGGQVPTVASQTHLLSWVTTQERLWLTDRLTLSNLLHLHMQKLVRF